MQDISLHILDIAENSVNAGASLISISIAEDDAEGLFIIRIEDNGKGIPEETLDAVLNPFYTTRTTRKIGLGLPLLDQAARATGGSVSIQSTGDTGTAVTALFHKNHIDMKPLGRIPDTIASLLLGNPQLDIVFTYRLNEADFRFDTRELRTTSDNSPLIPGGVIVQIRKYLDESLSLLLGDRC